jgi:hypothetical protein
VRLSLFPAQIAAGILYIFINPVQVSHSQKYIKLLFTAVIELKLFVAQGAGNGVP